MYRGLALGGPLDGKSVVHDSPRYKVPEIDKVEPYVSLQAVLTSAARLDVFEYVHVETPGGDVWVPSTVTKGERYEHKIFKHPLDYIFSKLMRGYKPDGY